jgi:Ca2+-binding EF-hand superfamily protein
LKKLDRDGDGILTTSELQNKRAFAAFDRNKDGSITAAEAGAALAAMSAENRSKLPAAIQTEIEKTSAPETPTKHRASYSTNLKERSIDP